MSTPVTVSKPRSNVLEVVNLAIERDRVAARGGEHRLVAFGREIKDGEPTECQADSSCSIVEDTRIVRAPVGKRCALPVESLQRILPALGVPDARDAAHPS